MHALVDGRGARYFNEIRLLAGNTSASSQTTAFSRLGALLAAVTVDAHFSYLGNIRASAHMTAASGGEDNIIAVKTGAAAAAFDRAGLATRAVAPGHRAAATRWYGYAHWRDVCGRDPGANADLHTQLRVETQ